MSAQRGITALLLHIVRGKLWYGADRPVARLWEGDLDEFLGCDWLGEAGCIKVLGAGPNAEILTKLYDRKVSTGAPRSIQVGSPLFYHGDGDNVADIFRYMLELERAPSVGGWHEMASSDYTTYSIIKELQKESGGSQDKLGHLYRAHPASAAISFVGSVSQRHGIELIASMTDPRFFICSTNPDRSSRLRKYFIMAGKTGVRSAWEYLNNTRTIDQDPDHNNAVQVFRAWYGGLEHFLKSKNLIDGWTNALKSSKPIGPNWFLIRAARRQYAEGKTPVEAFSIASRIFLSFVRNVWLDRLTPSRKYVSAVDTGCSGGRTLLYPTKIYAPQLFVPEYFFHNEDEIVAWNSHIQQLT